MAIKSLLDTLFILQPPLWPFMNVQPPCGRKLERPLAFFKCISKFSLCTLLVHESCHISICIISSHISHNKHMTTYIAYACSHFPIQLITMNARSLSIWHHPHCPFLLRYPCFAPLYIHPPLWVGELIVYTSIMLCCNSSNNLTISPSNHFW